MVTNLLDHAVSGKVMKNARIIRNQTQ